MYHFHSKIVAENNESILERTKQMSITKALKHILIDKGMTQTQFAELMDKPYRTVVNTFMKDNMRTKTAVEYGKALGYSLCYVNDETGEIVKISD